MTEAPETPVVDLTGAVLEPEIAQRITDLQTERERIAAAEYGDPVRGAEDLDAWHARDRARADRLREIEGEERELREFGSIVQRHPDALRQYTAIARPIGVKHKRVAAGEPINDDVIGAVRWDGTARQDIEAWWGALRLFAQTIGDDEQARIVITREVEAWFRTRDGIAYAALGWLDGMHLHRPELDRRDLPDWLRWGAHRLDRERA